ncbi:MAG: hypothetical protein BRC41_10750 [Cyanobacteria bacterium QH_9_48_43]|nr:MAG: hypothetical protein BRC41_10750 [Cyanobacteria bacterium QH_9_48_43]PSP12092.1 MAG: hypothetical protein BRC50_09945 [Cyanobacteria bacterium SW_11_48_12]PSP24304.1 MAG: hypothetical protein BRC55_07740 [Cyanobacteria bacterium SW_8_48_13]
MKESYFMSVSQERLRQVQQWLIKAQHDLQAARALANQTSPLLDVAIYHCQQAAEKAIKVSDFPRAKIGENAQHPGFSRAS